MYKIVILQEGQQDRILDLDTASLPDIVIWINQSSNIQDRSKRKQLAHYRLYGNPMPLSEFMKSIKKGM